MTQRNQMLLIWTLSKAYGAEKKAVQPTVSILYTSCLISSRRKTRRGQYQTFCSAFPGASLPLSLSFLKSDLIKGTHPTFSLPKWELRGFKNVHKEGFSSDPCRCRLHPLATPTSSVLFQSDLFISLGHLELSYGLLKVSHTERSNFLHLYYQIVKLHSHWQ